jgi:mono/diheme cytochrome c family protein
MLPHPKLLALVFLVGSGAACTTQRYSPAAFHLPADGDADKGKLVFVSMGCHKCHAVAGVDLERPTVQPPIPVVLGGEVDHRLSDAYLVTSVINPSYALAPHPKEQITRDGKSLMPNYADRLTARQITDLVAFLQAHYVVRIMRPEYPH